jgi:hypothetical protein
MKKQAQAKLPQNKRKSHLFFNVLWIAATLGLALGGSTPCFAKDQVSPCISARLSQRFANQAIQAALLPADLVQKLWSKVRLPEEGKNFDLKAFERARLDFLVDAKLRQYGSSLRMPNQPPPRLEEWLAFLEAATSKSAVQDPLGVASIVQGPDSTKQNTLLRLASRLKKKASQNKLSSSELDEILADTYVITHQSPTTLRGLLPDEKNRSVLERLIGQRYEQELLKRNAEDVFRESGLLSEPGQIERFRQSVRSRADALSSAYPRLQKLSAFLLGLPISSRKSVEIPQSIRNKVLKDGIDAAYPDLLELEKRTKGKESFNQAQFDLKYHWLQRIYLSIAGSAAASVSIDTFKEKYEETKKIQALNAAAQSLKESIPSSPEDVLNQVVQGYQDEYRAKHGEEKLQEHLKSEEYHAIEKMLLSH